MRTGVSFLRGFFISCWSVLGSDSPNGRFSRSSLSLTSHTDRQFNKYVNSTVTYSHLNGLRCKLVTEVWVCSQRRPSSVMGRCWVSMLDVSAQPRQPEQACRTLGFKKPGGGVLSLPLTFTAFALHLTSEEPWKEITITESNTQHTAFVLQKRTHNIISTPTMVLLISSLN